jgi:hypothetical protein
MWSSSGGGGGAGGGKGGGKAAEKVPVSGGEEKVTWRTKGIDELLSKHGETTKTVATQTAKDHAARIAADAARREPKISESIKGAASAVGGELAGFDFRLKTEGSMARKIETMAQEEHEGDYGKAAASVKDAVRYTVVVDEGAYWAKGNQVRDTLHAEGWSDNGKQAEGWAKGYRGRNMKLKDPNGYPVEVQIHTKASKTAALKGHLLYDVARLPTTPASVRAILDKESDFVFNSVPLPADLPNRAELAKLSAS